MKTTKSCRLMHVLMFSLQVCDVYLVISMDILVNTVILNFMNFRNDLSRSGFQLWEKYRKMLHFISHAVRNLAFSSLTLIGVCLKILIIIFSGNPWRMPFKQKKEQPPFKKRKAELPSGNWE